MFKLIVAGSRNFNDYNLLEHTLDKLLIHKKSEGIEIVSGAARGADRLGERYAREKGYNIKLFPADWKKLGKSAGYIRNKEMSQYAQACLLFWDGRSRGTKHMYDLAKKQGLQTRIAIFEDANDLMCQFCNCEGKEAKIIIVGSLKRCERCLRKKY